MAVKPLDLKNLKSGMADMYENVCFIAPDYNCCVEKVVGELGTWSKHHKMSFSLGMEEDPKAIIGMMPDHVIYFRVGTKPGVPLQQLAMTAAHIPYFKGLGLRVGYYIDDLLFDVNNQAPLKIMAECDYIIVATPALGEWLIDNTEFAATIPIYQLYTHMDFLAVDSCAKPTYLVTPGKRYILFPSQGRIGALEYYGILERMNQNPEKYKDVTMISVSHQAAQIRTLINRFRNVRKMYYEFMPSIEFYGLCKLVDIIVAPGIPGDLEYFVPEGNMRQLWLDCKSPVKYTLAGAASVPIISAPLREYAACIEHGKTGYIANSIDEWMQYIDLLLENPDLRKEIGTAARKDIEKNFDPYNRVKELYDILHQDQRLRLKYAKKVSDVHSQL